MLESIKKKKKQGNRMDGRSITSHFILFYFINHLSYDLCGVTEMLKPIKASHHKQGNGLES